MHNGGGLFLWTKRVLFCVACKHLHPPRACNYIIWLQASQSLSIRLQICHTLWTTCLWKYHIVASQLVSPPWHPCKSTPWQASDLQFHLHARWHIIGMTEWHLCVTPMLPRKGRCISLLPSLFLGVGFGSVLWWVCLPDQRQVSLIYFHINFDSTTSWSLPPPLGLYYHCHRGQFPHPYGNVHAVLACLPWGRPQQHHCQQSCHRQWAVDAKYWVCPWLNNSQQHPICLLKDVSSAIACLKAAPPLALLMLLMEPLPLVAPPKTAVGLFVEEGGHSLMWNLGDNKDWCYDLGEIA